MFIVHILVVILLGSALYGMAALAFHGVMLWLSAILLPVFYGAHILYRKHQAKQNQLAAEKFRQLFPEDRDYTIEEMRQKIPGYGTDRDDDGIPFL